LPTTTRKIDRPPGGYPSIGAEPGSLPDLRPKRSPLWLAAVAAVALLIGLFVALRGTSGALVVTVAGSGGQALDAVQVLVDGQVRCHASPCRVDGLPSGTHMVRARADGYQETAEIAVTISGGEEAVRNLNLVQATGTGIRVSGEGPSLVLFVDGREVGPLPQELSDLSPGEHRIRVQSEHFEPYEQTVLVKPNEMQTIGPLRLPVTKGLAHIKAGSSANGAKVILETGNERRSLPSLPMDLQIDTSKPHRLVATKKGFEEYSETISFAPGEPEREFLVELEPMASEEPVANPGRVGRVRPPSGGAATGQATLSLNSIPSSKVILDGRPLGDTPKVGVSVDPGSHTVVFVRDGERQSKSVTVAAGEKKTVVHRFK
jgi:serine/threonine-protein kinase